MDLTIEHLAAYLPYALQIQYVVRGNVEKTGYMRSISHNEDETHPTKVCINYNDPEHIWMFRPILLPLSELSYFTNGLKHMGYKIEKDDIENIISDIKQGKAEYDIMQMCFKEHIDVFSLIPAGIAIDKNTLNK